MKHLFQFTHPQRPLALFGAVLAFSLLILTGCGGGSADGLADKKAKLATLQSDLNKLTKEIKTLEGEIAALDTTSKAELAQVPVKVEKVKAADFKHFIKVQGQITADNLVMVSPEVPGVVSRVSVKNGQRVSKGQLIAEINSSVIRNQLAQLNTSLALANTVFQKQESLWKQKIGTEMQFLQAKANKESIERNISTIQSQLRMYQMRAPISGTIDQLSLKRGQAAAPGQPGCLVVNLSDLKFSAEISESYIPYIKKGDKVSVYFSTLGENIEAAVTNISQTIHPMNRTVQIEINLPRGTKNLKANMMGEVSINDKTVKDATAISLSHIQKSKGGQFVYLAQKGEDGKWIAKKVSISKGISYADKVEINKGLKAGDLLITEGFQSLSEGQEIKFVNAESI